MRSQGPKRMDFDSLPYHQLIAVNKDNGGQCRLHTRKEGANNEPIGQILEEGKVLLFKSL